MKNLQQTNTFHLAKQQKLSDTQDLQDKTFHCPSKNVSNQICFNQKCHHNAFICDEESCSCQQKHPKCVSLNKNRLFKKIKSKIIPSHFVKNFINSKIQRLIDQLSNLWDGLTKWVQRNFSYAGLTDKEKQFLQNVSNNKKTNYILGKDIWQVINCETQRASLDDIINKDLKNLQAKIKQTQNNLLQYLNQIRNQMQHYEFKVNKNSKSTLMNLKQRSLIVRSDEQQRILVGFFENKAIDKMEIVYRASQNDFCLKKFHQKCANINDTVIIVQTEFGKKIGGYTPVKWKQVKGYLADDSRQSFVFSLTNNDKFTITKTQNALFIYPPHSINFGNDLRIYDKADIDPNSSAHNNFIYVNTKYKQNDKKSWESFSGNPDSTFFKIKEWQVWAVKFK